MRLVLASAFSELSYEPFNNIDSKSSGYIETPGHF